MYRKAYTNGANCTIRVILRNFPMTYKILSFSRLSILVNVKLQQQPCTGLKDIRRSGNFLPRGWLDCDAVTRNFCAVLIALLKFYFDFWFGHRQILVYLCCVFYTSQGACGMRPLPFFTRLLHCTALLRLCMA